LYDKSDTLLVCEIWIGATDCDFNTGIQVGSFEFDGESATFTFAENSGYAATFFSMYAGKCEGNDNGESLETPGGPGICDQAEVARYAATPQNFPLVSTTDGVELMEYTFNGDSPINTAVWPYNYEALPVKTDDCPIYIEAFCCIVPTEYDFDEEGASDTDPMDPIEWDPVVEFSFPANYDGA